MSIKHGVSPGSSQPANGQLLPLDQRIGAGPAILALANHHCKWPVGEVLSDDFHFCSKPRNPNISSPYCADHQAVVRSKNDPRPRY